MNTTFPISNRRATDRRKAFTLVELLVIVGILALLATIHVSALAGSGSRSKVAMCASNVRQLTLAMHLYAGDNKDKLPVNTGATVWAWDLPSDVGDRLLSYNLQKRTFYCPSTAPRFTDWDNYQNPSAFSTLWGFGTPNFHITGYLLALAGSASKLTLSNQNTTVLAEPVIGSPTLPPPPNSERVLTADVVISNGNVLPASPADNFDNVTGGFLKPHLSAHLRDRMPYGGNMGYKDGHVQWKQFKASSSNPNNNDSQVRTSTGPYFWW